MRQARGRDKTAVSKRPTCDQAHAKNLRSWGARYFFVHSQYPAENAGLPGLSMNRGRIIRKACARLT